LPKPALLPTKPLSFQRRRPASVNSVQVDFVDGSSFDIPAGANEMDRHIAKAYVAAVKAIDSDPRMFSTTSECAVCKGTGHPFSDCKVLKDVEFLKKHHIAYCVNQRRLKKLLATRVAVHALDAVLIDEATDADDNAPAPLDFC